VAEAFDAVVAGAPSPQPDAAPAAEEEAAGGAGAGAGAGALPGDNPDPATAAAEAALANLDPAEPFLQVRALHQGKPPVLTPEAAGLPASSPMVAPAVAGAIKAAFSREAGGTNRNTGDSLGSLLHSTKITRLIRRSWRDGYVFSYPVTPMLDAAVEAVMTVPEVSALIPGHGRPAVSLELQHLLLAPDVKTLQYVST